jgi:hypothetical protein
MKRSSNFTKQLGAVAFILTFFVAGAFGQTYTLTDDDVVVKDGIIESCSYNFELKNIIIPETLDGQTVIGIKNTKYANNGVFYNKGIISVKLPKSLQAIGGFAFYKNKLATIDFSQLSDLITIGDGAFNENNLISLDLIGCTSLIHIGLRAFYWNSISGGFFLPEVNFKGTLYKVWNDENGKSYTALTDKATNLNTSYVLQIPYTLTDDDVVVKNGIIESCSYNFELKNIIIPETLDGQTVIGIQNTKYANRGVFYNKGIISVKLPKSLQAIGGWAFNENKLATIDFSELSDLITIGDGAFNQNNLTSLDLTDCSSIIRIGLKAFYNNSISGGFFLPEVNYKGTLYKLWSDENGKSYTALADKATNLNTSYVLHIPYTLTDDDVVVKDGIIESCSYNFELKNIIIPETLDGQTVIGIQNTKYANHGVFYNKGIISVKLPKSLQAIGGWAFNENKLATIDFSELSDLITIGDGAFNQNNLTSLDLTDCSSIIRIGLKAFYNNSISGGFFLPEVNYKGTLYKLWSDENGKSYTALADKATNLNTSYVLHIPYTLTDDDVVVKDGIIESCSYNFELKNIIIPETLDGQTVIGIQNTKYANHGVFYNKGIISVKLPKSLQAIGGWAFNENKLATIDFSELSDLITIGDGAFNQNNLTSVDLSNCISLNYIGNIAFRYNDISTLNLSGCSSLTLIGAEAFRDNLIDTLNFNGCTALSKIDNMAFWFNAINNINLSECNSLTYIGEGAFMYNNFKNGFILPAANHDSTSVTIWKDGLGNSFVAGKDTARNYSTFYFLPPPGKIIEVCGEVFGVWVKGKTYKLNCDEVIVKDEKTLFIEAGVTVIADSGKNVSLISYGRGKILAKGTQDEPILFTSVSKEPGSWRGVVISGSSSTCEFKNCIFEYATTALSFVANANGCTSSYNDDLVDKCIVRNNSESGIYIAGTGGTDGCTFPSQGTSSPTITNSEIYNNKIGIDCYTRTGYYSDGFVDAKIYNNLIFNNQWGITTRGNDVIELKILNNTIVNNSSVGINSTHPYFNEFDYKIANNIIANNGIGIINEDSTAIHLNSNNLSGNTTDLQGVFENRSNIYTNPSFIDYNNYDFTLQPTSPCIDAGSNEFATFEKDFDGKVRIWDGNGDGTATVDIGAYEFGSISETAPVITRQPVRGSFCPGSNVELSVKVTAYPDPEYQWYRNDTIINGAIADELILPEPKTGSYTCSISNTLGSVTTEPAQVILFPVYDISLEETICQGESFNIGVESFSSDTTIIQNLISVNGCDSIVTTHLTVHPVYTMEEEVSICEGASWKGWIQSGTYTENLVAVSGCDSTVVTRLSVTPLPATPVLTQNADTLIASGQGVFTWYLEKNQITGALSSEYIIKNSGNYSVSVTNGQGCVSKVSVSIFVVKTSTQNQELNKLMVYPNPTTGKVTIEGLEATGKTLLSVSDNLGRELFKHEVQSTRAEVNLAGFAPGVYNITVVQGSYKAGFQVIKQ